MSDSNEKNTYNINPEFAGDNTEGTADSDECRFANSDINGGFQDVPPQLFITLGELIGNVTANKLPFNVQNAIGNWLQLVGQSILTFNAQQQYFQNGPGRYYNLKYRNVGNPFCPENSPQSSSSSSSSDSNNSKVNEKKIKESLSNRINSLEKEIALLRKEIEDLKKEI